MWSDQSLDSYQHCPRAVAVHADGEVVHGQRHGLGVRHGSVATPVLILDQGPVRQQARERALDRLGEHVDAGALEVVAASVEGFVVGVSGALTGGCGPRVAVSNAPLQGAVLAGPTAHRSAHLGKQ